MLTENYYTELELLYQKFHVEQSYKPDFGAFLCVRWLYSITATGGKWWQRFAFYVVFTLSLSPLTFAIDIAALCIYAAVQIVKKFLEGVLAAILTVCTKAAGTVAIIAAAVGTILIIYLKWDAIVIYVSGLF